MGTNLSVTHCAPHPSDGNLALVIVCHCENVNDRTVGAAVAAGATDLERVAAACRAGRQCGGCHDTIEAIVEHSCAVSVARTRRAVA